MDGPLHVIRSLCSQVQRISTTDSSNITRSVANGVLSNSSGIESKTMSTSISATLSSSSSQQQQKTVPCTCTNEIQNLRKSLTKEMNQLRSMIYRLENASKKTSHLCDNSFGEILLHEESGGGTDSSGHSSRSKCKRPFSLNVNNKFPVSYGGDGDSKSTLQFKFVRISACVKGYLTRRILRTEKLQIIIQTIRDTAEMILKLYEEVPLLQLKGSQGIKQEDSELCRRLLQQLTGACTSFHDAFFKLTKAQQMAIIANDREKLRAKELKTGLAQNQNHFNRSSNNNGSNSHTTNRQISKVTIKCLQRRLSSQ